MRLIPILALLLTTLTARAGWSITVTNKAYPAALFSVQVYDDDAGLIANGPVLAHDWEFTGSGADGMIVITDVSGSNVWSSGWADQSHSCYMEVGERYFGNQLSVRQNPQLPSSPPLARYAAEGVGLVALGSMFGVRLKRNLPNRKD